MDPYVVKIRHEAVDAGRTAAKPSRRRRRRRVGLGVVVLVFAGTMLFHGDAVRELAGRAVEVAQEPLRRLRGDDELRKATHALGTQWREQGTYRVTEERLAELQPRVDWGGTVVFRPCFGGTAAVLVATTTKGDVSRLVIRGAERGDVPGRHGCPFSESNMDPWAPIP